MRGMKGRRGLRLRMKGRRGLGLGMKGRRGLRLGMKGRRGQLEGGCFPNRACTAVL